MAHAGSPFLPGLGVCEWTICLKSWIDQLHQLSSGKPVSQSDRGADTVSGRRVFRIFSNIL